MKEFESLPGWESIIDWKLQPWHGGKGPSLSLLARGPDGHSWRCRELSRGLRSPRGAQQLLAPVGFPRASSARQQWEGTPREALSEA